MAEDAPPGEEPTTGDRTETERLATAAERAAMDARPTGREGNKADRPIDADDSEGEPDEADTTDMNAVGDDGQVFGG